MSEPQKNVVRLEVDDVGKIPSIVDTYLNGINPPDRVLLQLDSINFPRRTLDFPEDVRKYIMIHPKVKVEWKRELPISDNTHEYLDMTMVSVFYDAGINELRKVATRKAVSHWIEQYHLPKEMMFIELGFNGVFTFSKEDFPEQIDYIRIDGNDSHKYLFQKEHLWNIAAKRAKYEKLMFVDSDIAPLEDVDWFKQVYDSLDKCLFTQGFSKIKYLNQNDRSYRLDGKIMDKVSYSYTYSVNGVYSGVPGGTYCISKTTLKQIGYFNYLPFGGGDDLFWSELLGLDRRFLFSLCKREQIKDILVFLSEKEKKTIVGTLPVVVHHFYHGERKSRSYGQRQYMLLTQFPWQDRVVVDDELGLASWIDTNSNFYHVASKLHEVQNKLDIASQLLDPEIDYMGFYREMYPVFNDLNRFRFRSQIVSFIMSSLEKFRRNEVVKPPDYDVVVSFTTYKNRFMSNEIWDFLESIVQQECPGIKYHIVVTLWNQDYRELSDELKKYFDLHGIEVIVCEHDWKPHKKYIYAMQKYYDIPVITVDDDSKYRRDLVKTLYEDHIKHPSTVICGRARKIEFDKNGRTTKYRSWKFISSNETSIDILPTGVGGVLYPPEFCRCIDEETFRQIGEFNLLLQDDFLLHYIAQQHQIPTKLVECNPPVGGESGLGQPIYELAHDEGSLTKINMRGKCLNDQHIYLFDYPRKQEDLVWNQILTRGTLL